MEKQEALIIHPYTYITLIGEDYLLYNTINGEYIRGNDLNIAKIIKRLLSTNSQWIYHVPTEDKDIGLSNFILEVKEKNIGDYIKNYNKQAPAQRAELDWLLYNKPLEYAQLVLGGEIEHYLSLGCDHGRLED